MTQDPTLVIGATGNVGRQVVAQLAEAGAPVRTLARRPPPAGLPSGVEYFQGDLAQPDGLEPALHEVGAVFLVWPFLTVEHAPAVLDVVSRHARRIVYLSSDGIRDEVERQSDPINQFHADVEDLIDGSTLEYTFLRASGLAANALQ